MRKHLIIYVLLTVPALIVAFFFNNSSMLSQGLQWIFAALMAVGWGINTAVAAYQYPRRTLVALLVYSGVTLFIIVMLYASEYGTTLHKMLGIFGGLLSFKPLDIVIRALLDFSIPHEIYVSGILVFFCLVGYAVGLVYRRVRPNPYHPKIIRY